MSEQTQASLDFFGPLDEIPTLEPIETECILPSVQEDEDDDDE